MVMGCSDKSLFRLILGNANGIANGKCRKQNHETTAYRPRPLTLTSEFEQAIPIQSFPTDTASAQGAASCATSPCRSWPSLLAFRESACRMALVHALRTVTDGRSVKRARESSPAGAADSDEDLELAAAPRAAYEQLLSIAQADLSVTRTAEPQRSARDGRAAKSAHSLIKHLRWHCFDCCVQG